MAWGRLRSSWYPAELTALLSLLLAAVLLAAAACAPPPPPPPPIKIPSKVVTEEGIEFSVYGLKLPGTIHELKLKKGGALIWVPLSIIQIITFTGPMEDQYRPAEIVLTSGEKVKGDLFVDQIIEGRTDLGYWNIALQEVRQVGMGEE